LKCKGSKKTPWQGDSLSPEARAPPHSMSARGPQPGVPSQGPPPAYPAQVKEEREEDFLYGRCLPGYLPSPVDYRHYGLHSPPMTGGWGHPGSYSSPVPAQWCPSPQELRGSGMPSSGAGLAGTLYPGMMEQPPHGHASTPDTPDSGYWEVASDGSPNLDLQYAKMGESWSTPAPKVPSRDPSHYPGSGQYWQQAPLPELSLHEILGELNEDWLGGEGLNPEDKQAAYC